MHLWSISIIYKCICVTSNFTQYVVYTSPWVSYCNCYTFVEVTEGFHLYTVLNNIIRAYSLKSMMLGFLYIYFISFFRTISFHNRCVACHSWWQLAIDSEENEIEPYLWCSESAVGNIVSYTFLCWMLKTQSSCHWHIHQLHMTQIEHLTW